MNREQYAQLITREMGKVISEARAEVDKSAKGCEYFANEAERLLQPRVIQTDAQQSYVAYRPLGVVLAILPGGQFLLWPGSIHRRSRRV